MTPVDLIPIVLANGGEEMQTALCCDEYELGLPGSLAATSNGIAKKTIETKGSFIVRLVKMFLELCRFELDRVRAKGQGCQQEAHTLAQAGLQVVG
jgi:hypothetical protein